MLEPISYGLERALHLTFPGSVYQAWQAALDSGRWILRLSLRLFLKLTYHGGGRDIMTVYLTTTLHMKQNLKYKTCGKGKINRPFHCNII